MLPNLKTCLFLTALAATQTAHACVKITAFAAAGLSANTEIIIEDNGKRICKSVNPSGAVNCDVKGYGMKWGRIRLNEDIPVEYRTPHGTYNLKVRNPRCVENNGCCGGGIIPCTCTICYWSSHHFCG